MLFSDNNHEIDYPRFFDPAWITSIW